ncbi:hypothetical protein ACKKBG_A34530 [Auxenochlorella protothecoides x Auxenochlorella symbiontica]|uniref:UspA domain-containing protein n=2 Tax=Auxenochlorella protothecoides TaxID=3075 RepID=A0A1D1ZU46_AUXPR
MTEDTTSGSRLGGDRGQAPQPTTAPSPQHRPILSVDRTEEAMAQRHILIPVDDTDDSEVAISWATKNVYRHGDVFHLLHVVPEPTMVHIWGGVYVPPDESAELQEIEDTKHMVSHRFAEALVAAKVPFKLHVIVGPSDTDSIARVVSAKAADLGAQLVVVARHSKGKLKEFLVGSVTASIVKSCTSPVLVVPHPSIP